MSVGRSIAVPDETCFANIIPCSRVAMTLLSVALMSFPLVIAANVGSHRHGSIRRMLPQKAPNVTLPFGDINLVVVTDVHSWIAGHGRHDSDMNADYGDVLSFYQRLQQYADYAQKDLFFVMNGDFMDGTGLSTTPPRYLTPLLERMPWDVVNLGNHELYDAETVDWIVDNFVPHWRGNYLSTNTLLRATGEPVGNRYTYLYGRHSGATVLAFGFLYNFKNNCNTTIVQDVQSVVRQDWFIDVLSASDYSAVLVMAHMHVSDPLVDVIREAIRGVAGGDMPIQFITGHSHIRGYEKLDEYAASFEAGKFLDTVGFCSFPVKDDGKLNGTSAAAATAGTSAATAAAGTSAATAATAGTSAAAAAIAGTSVVATVETQDLFPHVFLDANHRSLSKALGVAALPTAAGIQLTDKIHQTQEALGLMEQVGCATHTYTLGGAIDEPYSLWGLYLNEVIPAILLKRDRRTIFVQSTGGLRYSLEEGDVSVDDIISVCPFNDTVYRIGDGSISGETLLKALNITDINQPEMGQKLPHWGVSVNGFLPMQTYEILAAHFDANRIHSRLKSVTGLPLPPPMPLLSNATSSEYVHTTDMWMEYVAKYWPCHTPEGHQSGTPAEDIVVQEERPIATAIFIALVFIGVWLHAKRSSAQKDGYRLVDEAKSPSKAYQVHTSFR